MKEKKDSIQLNAKKIKSLGWFKHNNLWYESEKHFKDGKRGVSLTYALYIIKNRELEKNSRKQLIKEGLENVLCNQCGEKCYSDYAPDYYGLIDCKVSGGFSSEYLIDGNIYTFSLCEKCLTEMFEKFKIPVIIEKYI
jgi:hypothetical protein